MKEHLIFKRPFWHAMTLHINNPQFGVAIKRHHCNCIEYLVLNEWLVLERLLHKKQLTQLAVDWLQEVQSLEVGILPIKKLGYGVLLDLMKGVHRGLWVAEHDYETRHPVIQEIWSFLGIIDKENKLTIKGSKLIARWMAESSLRNLFLLAKHAYSRSNRSNKIDKTKPVSPMQMCLQNIPKNRWPGLLPLLETVSFGSGSGSVAAGYAEALRKSGP